MVQNRNSDDNKMVHNRNNDDNKNKENKNNGHKIKLAQN